MGPPDFAPRFGNPLSTFSRARGALTRYRVGAPTDLLSSKKAKFEMVAKRGSRTRTKRRRPRRGRKSMRRRHVPRTLTTASKVISCKASNYVNFTGTGAITAFLAQLNSCDDVYSTSVAENGQPLGYDQWKALYKRAIVLSSRIYIQWHNRGTSAVMVGIWPSPLNNGTTTLTNYEYYNEVAGNKQMLLSPEQDHTIMWSSRSTKKHLQVTKVKDNAELSIDLVNETPPTKLAWWQYYAQAVDQTSAFAVDAVVTVRYIVLLLDPIIPARSTET